MQEFEGCFFSDEQGGERLNARVIVRGAHLQATAPEGEVELPLQGIQLKQGGASGKMFFCRHKDAPGVVIIVENPSFPKALEDMGGPSIRRELEGILQERRKTNRQVWLGVAVVLLSLYVLFVGFKALVEQSVDWIPYSVDETLGDLAQKQMMGSLGVEIKDPVVVEGIDHIVQRITPERSLKEASFSVTIVESDQVNAFALPGGHIVVFTGLIAKAETPEEVAAVIGHEMAHVTQRHGMRRLVSSVGIIAGFQLLIGDIAGASGAMAELFSLAAINGYSREQETEADLEGIRMLAEAGISPHGAVRFFEKMKEDEGPLESSGLLSWIGTHPDHGERVGDLKTSIKNLPPLPVTPIELPWEEIQKRVQRGYEESPSTPKTDP